MKPVVIGPFLGMNNRLPAEKLQVKEGDFVRSAVNGDFTTGATFRRRKGFTPALAGTNMHSIVGFGDDGYVVDGNTLFRLNKDVAGALVKTAIYTVTPNAQFSFTAAPNAIYASNGKEFVRIVGGWARPLGLPSADPPRVSATEGGLPAGVYQLAASFRDDDGRDSGVSMTVRIELPTGGGIMLDWVPTCPETATILYMTPPNGDTLFEVGVVKNGIAVVSTPPEGARPVANMTAPLPAGQIVRYHKGRLYSAAGQYLFYSEPYGLELCDLAENCLQFPEQITLVEPCVNGMYISADKTYWLDTETLKLSVVLPYRAVGGTGNIRRDIEEVWWMSERGIVAGDAAGNVKNMQEESLAVQPAQYGAAFMREEDGEKQLVSTNFNPQQTITAARSWMEAEIIRKETIV